MARAPPPRPPPWEERLTDRLLRSFAPPRGAPVAGAVEPPPHLAPFERVRIGRRDRHGGLDATWYPAPGPARGAVLLVHPWLNWGQAYFHRRGRIEALREAGYHALTFDGPGFGASSPPAGYWDRDVADALDALAQRAPGLPLHAWGVSSGGYWLHTLLSRRDGVLGVAFEDVSPHLVEYAENWSPRWRPGRRSFGALAPRADRFLDLRNHAPHLRVRAASYVGGEADRGVPPDETRRLARLARAECLIVPGAAHLEAIKRDQKGVVGAALGAFARAERGLIPPS